MADRIVKPDSGNDLVLQNDDGSAKVFVYEAGTVAITPQVQIDNIKIDGNSITSEDSNGHVNITPNGTGDVVISKVDINSGTIDGATIATSDVTVGSGKTLDVNAGTLTTSTAQKQAIVDGATIEAQDLASGSGTTLPNNVQDAITRLGTVTSGTFNSTIGSSASFPAGTVLQVQHFQSQETNGLDASWTNLFENAITLKSASSDIIVLVNGNYQIPNGQGFGMRIYRDNSSSVTDADTLVWNLNNTNTGGQNYTIYSNNGTQRNDMFTINGKDTLSGFSAGDTLYYALLCQIYDNSGSAVQIPTNGSGTDGGFTMLLMEVQK